MAQRKGKKTKKVTRSTKASKVSRTSKASKVTRPARSGVKLALLKLNKWNIALAILLLTQAIAIVVLGKGHNVPVVTNFLTTDSLASQGAGQTAWAPALRHLFDVNLVYLTAAFLAIGAVFQGLVATVLKRRYEADLKKKINKIRWLEYIIGGGLMLIVVALLNGIYDASSLLAIFALSEILGLFVLLVEANPEVGKKHPRVVNKLAFVAGITPWLMIAISLFGAQIYGDRSLPAHIYFIDGTIFALFMAKPIIMYLNGLGRGKWKDYLYAERSYLIANFLISSALAWQVFFGTLR